MNTIKFTHEHELCERDRKLLEDIRDLLQNVGTPYSLPQDEANTEEATVDTPATIEAVTAVQEAEKAPQITHEDLYQKVRKLSQPESGKREETKNTILAYADRVSAIPEDKLLEVWNKLIELEG